MTDLKEQHSCNRFSFKLGRWAAEMFRVFEVAFSEHVVWTQCGVNTSFWVIFQVKNLFTSLEGIKWLGHTLMSETIGSVWLYWGNLSWKTEELADYAWSCLHVGEFILGQFRGYWKAIRWCLNSHCKEECQQSITITVYSTLKQNSQSLVSNCTDYSSTCLLVLLLSL